MSRETENLIHTLHEMMDGRIVGVQAELTQTIRPKRALFPPIHAFGKPINTIQRQTQRLADFAHRTFTTIGDHLGGQGRPISPILAVDILNHLFTALVLEVNINVRRLVALATDESLKEQIDSIGINSRHAQAIAHR